MTKTLHYGSFGMIGVFAGLLLGNLATYKALSAGVGMIIGIGYTAIFIGAIACVGIAKARRGWHFRQSDAIGALLPAIVVALAFTALIGVGIWTGAAS